jgi:plasmid stabilization system protein ParE
MVAPGVYLVIVSPRAFDDLDRILDHIKAVSPANAAKVIDRLRESMQRLRDLPHRYRVVQGMSRPKRAVRRMPVPPFLVYYRIDEPLRVVRILTVTHGSQRQPRRFG